MRPIQTPRPFIFGTVAIFALLLTMGCSSTHRIQNTWQPPGTITVDGKVEDWAQIQPQYYNEESRVSIRTTNDNENLFVCLTVGSRNLSRKMMHNGLTLTLGPDEGEDQPFALLVKRPTTPNKNPKDAGTPPRDSAATPSQVRVDITSPSSSGPLTLSLAEARDKGIDVFMGPDRYDRLVFEAQLRLDEVSRQAGVNPNTRIKLTFESSGTEKSRQSMSRGSGGKGGGRKGGRGMNGARPSAEPFKAELDITLAGGVVPFKKEK